MPNELFFSYVMVRTSCILWDDDHFIPDQHA